MGPRRVGGPLVAAEAAEQVTLGEPDDVVQALAPDRADHALGERVLPRRRRGEEARPDAPRRPALLEDVAGDTVAIAEELGRRRGPGERGLDVLGGPGGRRRVGDAHAEELLAIVAENHEREEPAAGQRRHHEDVDRRQVAERRGPERPPGWRRPPRPPAHGLGDGQPGHRGAQPRQFSLDPAAAPGGCSRAMRWISARRAPSSGGRPVPRARDRQPQESWTPRRCHASTVAGRPMSGPARQPPPHRASHAPSRRSRGRRRGRATERCRTAR